MQSRRLINGLSAAAALDESGASRFKILLQVSAAPHSTLCGRGRGWQHLADSGPSAIGDEAQTAGIPQLSASSSGDGGNGWEADVGLSLRGERQA